MGGLGGGLAGWGGHQWCRLGWFSGLMVSANVLTSDTTSIILPRSMIVNESDTSSASCSLPEQTLAASIAGLMQRTAVKIS